MNLSFRFPLCSIKWNERAFFWLLPIWNHILKFGLDNWAVLKLLKLKAPSLFCVTLRSGNKHFNNVAFLMKNVFFFSFFLKVPMRIFLTVCFIDTVLVVNWTIIPLSSGCVSLSVWSADSLTEQIISQACKSFVAFKYFNTPRGYLYLFAAL